MNNYKTRVLAAYKAERAKNLKAEHALCIAKHLAKYGYRSPKRDILPAYILPTYSGEQITELRNGWKIKVEVEIDRDARPPWENSDEHGVVTAWQDYDDALDAWELLSDRLGHCRYYDWRATLPIAIKDGWDAPPFYTGNKRERAMRAIKADYEYLRRWCAESWWYVGLIVTLLGEDDEVIAFSPCWGYESNAMDHICSEARSWASRMIRKERRDRREAARRDRISNRFQDAMACGL